MTKLIALLVLSIPVILASIAVVIEAFLEWGDGNITTWELIVVLFAANVTLYLMNSFIDGAEQDVKNH